MDGRRKSAPLFPGAPVRADADFLDKAGPGEFCWAEGQALRPYAERIEKLICFRWNRRYPGDVFLDLPLEDWRLTERVDFPGFSHEKITRRCMSLEVRKTGPFAPSAGPLPAPFRLRRPAVSAPDTDLSNLPAYSGAPYVVLDGNVPDFSQEDLTETAFEHYSPLDALGRCGAAWACVGQELMPTEERGAASAR